MSWQAFLGDRPRTLAAVQEWAQAKFPLDFAKLPDHTTLNFMSFQQEAWCREMGMLQVPTVALHVGACSHGRTPGFQLYAIVHGEPLTYTKVAWIAKCGDGSYKRLPVQELDAITFDEPFSMCCDPKNLLETLNKRLKAVVCFYFLAANHLNEFLPDAAFQNELRRACAWYNSGSQKQDEQAALLQLQNKVKTLEADLRAATGSSASNANRDNQRQSSREGGPEIVHEGSSNRGK
ncbi:hypothetical protein K491DRAFT_83201 [Lophiostoma macrostomum CBS 122681]|uniref:Uncharacterized protein n=1 Tax=Lophiostoma macrostomum CBS 122681 TaxID=1314788 RepID=A0A6A6SVL9_9PLEO|nr:hypothetical protein K491DRAFT_83201 [Lophiostoma macrostomum CBS 122681]